MSRRDADRGGNGTPWKRGRILAALLFLPLLAGCQQIAGNILQVSRVVIKERLPVPLPSRSDIAALPYAQIWVQGLGKDARLVLGEVDEGRLAWYSADGTILFTRDGQLVGSHGIGTASLMDVRTAQLPADLRDIVDGHVSQRHYDLMPGYRYGVPVTGTWSRQGVETVDVAADRQMALLRLEERLDGPGIQATQVYWVDPQTGQLWKSRQWLAPGRLVDITVLKPYRR